MLVTLERTPQLTYGQASGYRGGVLFARAAGMGDLTPQSLDAAPVGDLWDWLGGAVDTVGKYITAPVKFTSDVVTNIANGVRIDKAFGRAFEYQVQLVRDIAPFVQLGLSFIPGIGQGISAAIGAGLALAEGKPISEAFLEGVKGALPGGPLAVAAFNAAAAAVQGVAAGKSIEDIGLDVVRSELPDSDYARAAFDAGVALCHGKSLQDAAIAGVADLVPDNEIARVAFDLTKAGLQGVGPAAATPEQIASVPPLPPKHPTIKAAPTINLEALRREVRIAQLQTKATAVTRGGISLVVPPTAAPPTPPKPKAPTAIALTAQQQLARANAGAPVRRRAPLVPAVAYASGFAMTLGR